MFARVGCAPANAAGAKSPLRPSVRLRISMFSCDGLDYTRLRVRRQKRSEGEEKRKRDETSREGRQNGARRFASTAARRSVRRAGAILKKGCLLRRSAARPHHL